MVLSYCYHQSLNTLGLRANNLSRTRDLKKRRRIDIPFILVLFIYIILNGKRIILALSNGYFEATTACEAPKNSGSIFSMSEISEL